MKNKMALLNSDCYTATMEIYGSGNTQQICIGIDCPQKVSSAVEIVMDFSQNDVYLFDRDNKMVSKNYEGTLRRQTWHRVTIKAIQKKLYFYIDGRMVVQSENPKGYTGMLFFDGKENSARIRNFSWYASAGILVKNGEQTVGVLEGGTPMMLPGCVQKFTWISAKDFGKHFWVDIYDSADICYETVAMTEVNGLCEFSYIPRGAAGEQKICLRTQAQDLGTGVVYMQTKTTIHTDNEAFNTFYQKITSQITDIKRKAYDLDGFHFKMYMSWLRDHTHMMKAGIYLREGFRELLDFWLTNQHEEGFFYEMILPVHTPQYRSFTENSRPKFYKSITDDFYLLRFEIEADIEYLVVNGVYMIWQATGDDEWMREKTHQLERALIWTMTNSKRWSDKYDLPIRGHSVDTYDFVYGQSVNRSIVWWEKGMESGTPMSIFHGDCTGFSQACRQLGEMFYADGNTEKAFYWKDVAERIMTKLTQVAWNGHFFAHMVLVHPSREDLPESYLSDFDGDWLRLSFSNALALNREILSETQATSIIETFMKIRENPPAVETADGYAEGKLFAEWVSIYPSYRKNLNSKANSYVNGCIPPLCGGELANGCFKWGYSTYGMDILNRLKQLCERDGKLFFFYYQDGTKYTYPDGSDGGPSTWGATATHNAIIEGLAGFSDKGKLMENVVLAPAWVAGEFSDVYASVSYGAKDCYVAYTAMMDPKKRSVRYQIVGSFKHIDLQILIPKDTIPKTVQLNGKTVHYEIQYKGKDAYVVLSYSQLSSTALGRVEICC